MQVDIQPNICKIVISSHFNSLRGTKSGVLSFNTLRPGQNGRHFPDDICKFIFLNENIWISIEISMKFVPSDPINNIPALVQIMAWRRPGNKPLSEPMMFSLLTHNELMSNQAGYESNKSLTADLW